MVNLWYLSYICKLDNKKFHLMMFCSLQVCYFLRISQFSVQFITHTYISISSTILYTLSFMLTMIIHSIFVIKYWVLSKKIFSVISNQEDKNLQKKAWLIIIGQTLIIIIGNIFFILTSLKMISPTLSVIGMTTYVLPSFFIVGILGNAFWRLRKIGGYAYSISLFQIAI